jgi:hypothetical protein
LWCRDGLNGGTAVGTNIALYSQQFQQGTSWSTSTTNVGIAGNQTTAPDSTNTAATITPTVTNALHYTQQVITTIAGIYTISVYAKPNGYNWIALGEQGGTAWAYFNVSTGAIGNTNGSPTTSITNVGNGWHRCSITFTSAGGTRGMFVLVDNANGSLSAWSANGTSGAYVWGAQQVQGSVLTDYQVTTTAAVFGWSKSNATVAKNQTGIDGVANAATSITATAANAVLIQPISLASGSRTSSVYLKRITGTGNVQVTLDGSTWSTVDLSNGLWNRIVLSGTVTNPCVGVLLATNGDAVAMDYAQVEDGAFVTSPILTTTATATRAIDSASMSLVNALPANNNVYNPNAYTIISNHLANNVSANGQAIYSFYQNNSNRIEYYCGTQGAVSSATIDGPAGRVVAITSRNSILSGVSILSVRPTNISFSNSGRMIYNSFGSVPMQQSPFSIPNIYVGNANTGGSPLNGYIKRLCVLNIGLNVETSQLISFGFPP